jgi:hypothetical protein
MQQNKHTTENRSIYSLNMIAGLILLAVSVLKPQVVMGFALYDVEADPFEHNDLSTEESYASILVNIEGRFIVFYFRLIASLDLFTLFRAQRVYHISPHKTV